MTVGAVYGESISEANRAFEQARGKFSLVEHMTAGKQAAVEDRPGRHQMNQVRPTFVQHAKIDHKERSSVSGFRLPRDKSIKRCVAPGARIAATASPFGEATVTLYPAARAD